MSYQLTFVFQFILFTLVFILVCLGILDHWFKSKSQFRLILLILFIFQIAAIALLKKEVGDVMLFSGAGYFFRNGVDFYTIDVRHEQYPFFPFLIFFHALGNRLSELFPAFTFSFFLKLLILLPALYFIAFLVYQKQTDPIDRRKKAFQFLVSPLTYSAVLFHGQTDVFLIALFLAASLYFLNTNNFFQAILAGILYGCSIATKTWSIIFLPLVAKFRQSMSIFSVFVLSTLGFLFVDIFLYTRLVGSAFRLVLPAVSRAGGPIGIWGWTFVLSYFPGLVAWITTNNLKIFASLLVILTAIIFFKKNNLFISCLLLILGFYLITPNWGIQYLFWSLPFIYLSPTVSDTKFSFWFLMLASIFMFLNYFNVAAGQAAIPTLYVNSFGLLLWLHILFWFASLLKQRPS